MLQFKKYKKIYNKDLILEIEDTFFDEGVYWIKGDNGSGKSTLVKSIAGLIPFDGEISLYGLLNNQKNSMTYRSIVNYGEAEPVYPEFLKGSDLVVLYQNVKAASESQVEYLLTRLGVKKFQSKEIGEYSSGMIKKLSLVLAFIGNPKLILLDEPLITLDKETTGIVMELIMENAAKGVSIIFTSHQEFKDKMNFPMNTLLLNNHHLTVNKC
jgi:ABC-2 type transport system ATP-binding protein